MEQKINKEQLADEYGSSFIGQSNAWSAAEQGYLAGWDACQQNLQQTACYTALELLEQMLNKEQEFSIQAMNYSTRQSVTANINAIRSVIEMIKERQANAV